MTDPTALQAETLLSLAPTYLVAGETLTIRAEALPPALLTDEPLQLDLVEVDDDGGNAHVVATFKVQAREAGFTQLRRVELASDEATDYDPAKPKADVSSKGHTYPFETTWKRAELVVVFAGVDEEHRVVVRAPRVEGEPVYEIGVQLRTAGGELVYDSGEQFATLDCWNALIHNCAAAAQTMLEGHHWLVLEHGQGDYYGSQSSDLRGTLTDCITYCKQVLRRGYSELCAGQEMSAFNDAHLSGSHFAKAARKAGWALAYSLSDLAYHRSVTKDQQDPYWRINDRAIKQQVFKTFNSEGVACNEPLDEVLCGVGGGAPDATASTRYDAYADFKFFLVALSLGDHMSMKVGDDPIYECHWSSGPTSARLFDRASQSWSSLKDYGFFYMAVPAPYLNLDGFPGKTADERKAQLEPVWDEICAYTGVWRPSDLPEEGESQSLEDWDLIPAFATGDSTDTPPPEESEGTGAEEPPPPAGQPPGSEGAGS